MAGRLLGVVYTEEIVASLLAPWPFSSRGLLF
jgi:hypothetical protein